MAVFLGMVPCLSVLKRTCSDCKDCLGPTNTTELGLRFTQLCCWGCKSSGMWHCVSWVAAKVFKGRDAVIFEVQGDENNTIHTNIRNSSPNNTVCRPRSLESDCMSIFATWKEQSRFARYRVLFGIFRWQTKSGKVRIVSCYFQNSFVFIFLVSDLYVLYHWRRR